MNNPLISFEFQYQFLQNSYELSIKTNFITIKQFYSIELTIKVLLVGARKCAISKVQK